MPTKKKPRAKRTEGSTVETFACPHCGVRFGIVELAKHIDESTCGQHLRERLGFEFTRQVRCPDPTPAQAKALSVAMVAVKRRGSGTVLELRRDNDVVIYIPQLPSGLRVERMPAPQFDAAYHSITEYPTLRCAVLYVEYAHSVGATQEVLEELARLVTLKESDQRQALERAQPKKKAPKKKKTRKKKAAKKKTKKRLKK